MPDNSLVSNPKIGEGSSSQHHPETLSETGESHSIKLKLPQFWERSPVPWFVQAEAQFSLTRTTSDISKFNYVLAALPQNVIESVLDYIEKPPRTEIYIGLKTLLIERHSLSESKRIEQLISGEVLGDRKPSEFYRYLKQLAGSSGTIGEQLIKSLWLRRLPQSVNVALISLNDKDISDLIVIADKIYEATQMSNNLSIVNHDSRTSATTDLRHEIQELREMVKKLSHSNRSRPQHRSNHSSNSQYSSRTPSKHRSLSRSQNTVCWYHKRFGDNARKCQDNCSFKKSATSDKSQKN